MRSTSRRGSAQGRSLQSVVSQEGTVGLFGGSFDPLHVGHLALCDYLLGYQELSGLERIWFMPTPQNPLKETATVLPYVLRCRMIERAIRGDSRYALSTIESLLPSPHYTIETLEALQEAYPRCTFCLIIGADSLATLARWHRHDELLARAPLVVYPRQGYDIISLARLYPTATLRLMTQAPLIELSSTQIRSAIREQRDLRHWLPQPDGYDMLRHYFFAN